MIVKEWTGTATTSRKLKAGHNAEKQMAFYLKREFGKDEDVFIFNGIRFVHDGEVAQIDHLILHKYGFVLVESKSITGTVEINEHNEWTQWVDGKPQGMRSPLIQMKMQRNILHEMLTDHADQMLGKLLGVQKLFGGRKYDFIAAISDKTHIKRTYEITNVFKADAVALVVREKIKKYKRDAITGSAVSFNKKELGKICTFILASHCERKKRQTQAVRSSKVTAENKSKRGSRHKILAKTTLEKPPFICNRCEQPFEIRFGHSFYLYCPNCRRRPLPLKPKCIKCGADAVLEREFGTRIIQYKCSSDRAHLGIYHKNKDIYLKDEK